MSLIGCSSLAIALPMASHAEGFIDDAKATLNLRNAYFNRNYTNPAYPQGKAEEWTQNFILDAKSGFTQGTVGFGVDVLGTVFAEARWRQGHRWYTVAATGPRRAPGRQLRPPGRGAQGQDLEDRSQGR